MAIEIGYIEPPDWLSVLTSGFIAAFLIVLVTNILVIFVGRLWRELRVEFRVE